MNSCQRGAHCGTVRPVPERLYAAEYTALCGCCVSLPCVVDELRWSETAKCVCVQDLFHDRCMHFIVKRGMCSVIAGLCVWMSSLGGSADAKLRMNKLTVSLVVCVTGLVEAIIGYLL